MSELLKRIAKEKQVDPALIQRAADMISFHESKKDPKAVQASGGPGRGLFQYEVGPDQSADVALQRTRAAYKRYGLKEPSWLKSLQTGFDPAELTEQQQTELFLGDHRERPNSDFGLLGKMPLDEWWGKFHQTENDPIKRARFREDADYYKSFYGKA